MRTSLPWLEGEDGSRPHFASSEMLQLKLRAVKGSPLPKERAVFAQAPGRLSLVPQDVQTHSVGFLAGILAYVITAWPPEGLETKVRYMGS